MNAITGVETKLDNNGNITEVTINVIQHRTLIMPVLEQLGVVEKSSFMQEFENSIPLAEAQKHTLQFARSLWKK